MDTRQTVEAFVAAINAGDVEAIRTLMSEDHIFIDSLGNTRTGRAQVVESWHSYLTLFPDYRITIRSILTDKGDALLYGRAAATLHRDGKAVSSGGWEIPAAWRAAVEDAHITAWQVFADNKPVYALLGP